MIFTYLHSFMMFRKASRCGSYEYIQTAKSRMAMLFFGRNHPNYREIVYADLKQTIRLPEEVRELIQNTITTSRNGKIGHYQGGDALLEEINKNAKKWVIGVPTDKQWKQSFRNLDTVTKVCVFSSPYKTISIKVNIVITKSVTYLITTNFKRIEIICI